MSKSIRIFVPLLSVFLTACQTMGGSYLPVSELETFKPLPSENRVIRQAKVKWEVRADVQEYCAKVLRMDKNSAYMTPPLACAIWNVSSAECTIVTGASTSHVALGHELRHCFEGHFH